MPRCWLPTPRGNTAILQVLVCGGLVAVVLAAVNPYLAAGVALAVPALVLTINKVGEWKRRVEPCRHGTRAAKADSSLCAACVEAAAEVARETEANRARIAAIVLERKRGVLEKVKTLGFLQQMDPNDFQQLIWVVCSRLGFEVQPTPLSKDGGSDGFLSKGDERLVLQVKRYKGDVGEPVVRDLYGTVVHNRASGAWLVTTGRISEPARTFAQGKNLRLSDGKDLLAVIAEANLTADLVPDAFAQPGLPSRALGNVCPKCGSRLKRRRGRYGRFWGCAGYPDCKYTR